LVLVATSLMLVAEMFNTTIKALCDFVEPAHNEKIGTIPGHHSTDVRSYP